MASTERLVTAGLVLFLSVITFKDIMGSQDFSGSNSGDKVPVKAFSGPAIKFLYCYGWGYRKLFEDFSRAIQERYPEVEVVGENYPPPPVQNFMASALGYLKITLILCIVSGYNVFELVGLPTPGAMTWAWENKLYACMMIFFISNAIEGQLIATGAFEISFNGVEVWSKLRSGRPPSYNELVEILNSQSSASTPFSKPIKSQAS